MQLAYDSHRPRKCNHRASENLHNRPHIYTVEEWCVLTMCTVSSVEISKPQYEYCVTGNAYTRGNSGWFATAA